MGHCEAPEAAGAGDGEPMLGHPLARVAGAAVMIGILALTRLVETINLLRGQRARER
jgi:hypothetical protein